MSNITKWVKTGILAALLMTGVAGYSQTKAKTSTGVKAPSSVPVKKVVKQPVSTYQVKKDTLKILPTNLTPEQADSLHDTIIHTPVKQLIALYGQEAAMKIFQEHLLIEVNKARAENDNQQLRLNDTLNAVANQYAQYMADNNYETAPDKHLDKQGRRVDDRIYNYLWGKDNSYQVIGENIAINYTQTIASMMYGRLHSPAHRRTLMYDIFTDTGIGISGQYIVQIFVRINPNRYK